MEIIHLAGGKGKQAGQARTQARELSALGENQGDGVREGALGYLVVEAEPGRGAPTGVRAGFAIQPHDLCVLTSVATQGKGRVMQAVRRKRGLSQSIGLRRCAHQPPGTVFKGLRAQEVADDKLGPFAQTVCYQNIMPSL